jgi:hypothetical protein
VLSAPAATPPGADTLLVEFSCEPCRKILEKARNRRYYRILHRFNLDGALISTRAIPWRPRP